MTPPKPYRRILLKLSGEALMGGGSSSFDSATLDRIGSDIKAVRDMDVQVAVVVGGGNILRGATASATGIARATADYMGMLATVMNGLAIQSVLERMGCPARVLSAIPMPVVCEPYVRAEALRHLDEGRIVVFSAGTGNPFFTTDTAAALRAAEIGADVLMKGTQVDGVYTADPKKDSAARRYETLSFQDVLAQDLKVMDTASVALARDNGIPIVVFSIQEAGGFPAVARGDGRFTIVR
jgi:uridylate kinase